MPLMEYGCPAFPSIPSDYKYEKTKLPYHVIMFMLVHMAQNVQLTSYGRDLISVDQIYHLTWK